MQHQDRVGLGLGVSLVLPPTPTILEPGISSPRVLISPGCENSQGPHWGCLCLQGWGGRRWEGGVWGESHRLPLSAARLSPHTAPAHTVKPMTLSAPSAAARQTTPRYSWLPASRGRRPPPTLRTCWPLSASEGYRARALLSTYYVLAAWQIPSAVTLTMAFGSRS